MVDTLYNCLDVLEALYRLLFYTTSDQFARCWIER